MTEPYTYKDRDSKQVWLVGSDGRPMECTAWSCAPNSPDVWWCPAFGYSVQESDLFDNERACLDAARQRAQDALVEAGALVRELTERLEDPT